MKSGNVSLSTPEPNETEFVYPNACRSQAANKEAAGVCSNGRAGVVDSG